MSVIYFFFFQAEDGIRDLTVTGVQTCALPISQPSTFPVRIPAGPISPTVPVATQPAAKITIANARSEEHTSELQSQSNLVCRLLLEKKKNVTHSLSQDPRPILTFSFPLQVPVA